MSEYIKDTINATTGEVTRSYVDPELVSRQEAEKAEKESLIEAEKAAREAARQTALDKLKEIGLTDEEIAALLGGN